MICFVINGVNNYVWIGFIEADPDPTDQNETDELYSTISSIMNNDSKI